MTKTLTTAEPPRSHKTADLPELPDSIQRLHALRWEELTEDRGFTGDHLKWRDSSDRQYKDTGPQSPEGKLISLAHPPCADIRDRNPPGKRTFIGKNGEELDYQRWRDQTLADWHAGYSVRAARGKESIGVAETIALAKARFDSTAQDYFSVLTAPGVSEAQFDLGVEALRHLVVGEVSNLWRAEGDWFQRVCQPTVEDALSSLVKELKRRGRKLWAQRLEDEANGAPAAQAQLSPVEAGNGTPAAATLAVGGAQQKGRRGRNRTQWRVVDEQHRCCVELYDRILANEKAIVLENWLKKQHEIPRTSLTDYLSGRIEGKISPKRRKDIETALIEYANCLGISLGPTRTCFSLSE